MVHSSDLEATSTTPMTKMESLSASSLVTSSPASSSLTSVIVCMSIMAVSAVAYFAIRCYFEERRMRASARLCKCLPVVGQHGPVECVDMCTYIEKRAVSVATQTTERKAPWTDIRTSAGYKRTFKSPSMNNEDLPCPRPPATGSSRCDGQRRYRRKRPDSLGPSIAIMSPSSSDSYSVWAMSSNSGNKALTVKNLGTMTVSGSEEDVAGVSPFHPRYNTPVSQTNDVDFNEINDDRFVFNTRDVELGLAPRDGSDAAAAAADARTPHLSFRCRDLDAMKEPTIAEVASTSSMMSHSRCIEFETWPCGRLITRWTQTDGGSVMSLDWDHYDANGQQLCSSSSNSNAGRRDATIMACNGSDTTLLQGSVASPASPYVLCYECSDEFSVNDERKSTRFRPEPRNSSPLEREPLDLSVNHQR